MFAQNRSKRTSHSKCSWPYLPPRHLLRLCGTLSHLTPWDKKPGSAPVVIFFKPAMEQTEDLTLNKLKRIFHH